MHDDAPMRSLGQRMLANVDLDTVRKIDEAEAKRIALAVQAGNEIGRGDLLALALWAAKGGVGAPTPPPRKLRLVAKRPNEPTYPLRTTYSGIRVTADGQRRLISMRDHFIGGRRPLAYRNPVYPDRLLS